MYLSSVFANMPSRGLAMAKNFASPHVESLAENVLPDAIAKAFGDDEKFRAGCIESGKQPSAQFYESAHVTSAERAAARLRTGPAEVAEAIATANAVQEAHPFDPAFALQSARSAAESAEHHHNRVEEYQAMLRRHPGDQSIVASIKQHKEAAARYEEIVSVWDEKLRTHAA